MTEKAPERVWRLNGPGVMPSAEDHPGPCFECTKYVRADLAPQWRPISEAPEGKDLLVCVTHSIGLDEWETVQWVDCFTDLYGWRHFPHLIWVPFPPTHFMPLPEAPNE